MFASVHLVCANLLKDLFQPIITEGTNVTLRACPTPAEIHRALFAMGNYKSPGPDGMTVTFYKQYWGIVHEAIVREIQDFFQHGRLKPSFNHTFLALIPKMRWAARVDQFRPIALCNVTLKIITKIITGRLLNLLESIFHPSQAAFIPNRAINDNIIINHEVMCYMNQKKGVNGFMAIKIDLAKAYDWVEWGVLQRLMKCLGFDDYFTHLIMECISTARFSLLLNGCLYGYFEAQWGLRQGDPLYDFFGYPLTTTCSSRS